MQVKIAILGYGKRGAIYANYAKNHPEEFEVVAVAEIDAVKREIAKAEHHCPVFEDWREMLSSNLQADIIAVATQDVDHPEHAIACMEKGFDILLEKPIATTEKACQEILSASEKYGRKGIVCHVLRYSPFYKSIKALIDQGEIGRIVSMEMNEHVWIPHFLTSYVRGKWNSEKVCGSPVLLAKCCHDMDLICWLNPSKADTVSCYGHRSQFVKENAPKGATEFCYNCPHEKDCQYSAIAHYIRRDVMPFLVWDSLDKPYDQITLEEKMEFLKTSDYGRCAYTVDGDVMDRQNLLVDFEDGSVASFTLSCGTVRPDRYIHIVGTDGEVEGKLEDNKFVYRTYIRDSLSYEERVIDLSSQIVNNAQFGGHSGGDYGIMHDIVRYLNGERSSKSITLLEDSISSHLLVYAAEESRKTGRVVNL